MDKDLVCNFRKCRKIPTDFAWVTSCSHLFCEEDGTREFNKSYSCPACNTALRGKYDLIRVDLQPCEEYKSMVLAGHKPETLLDILSRAMAFWTYQSHQERTYQEFVASKAQDKITELEKHYEDILARTRTELNSLKIQSASSKKELEATKKQIRELSEKLSEKNRQYHNLQAMFNTLKRKSVTPATFDTNLPATCSPAARRSSIFDMHLVTREDLLRGGGGSDAMPLMTVMNASRNVDSGRPLSPAERDFVFDPNVKPPRHIGHETSDQGLQPIQNRLGIGVRSPNRMSRNANRDAPRL